MIQRQKEAVRENDNDLPNSQPNNNKTKKWEWRDTNPLQHVALAGLSLLSQSLCLVNKL